MAGSKDKDADENTATVQPASATKSLNKTANIFMPDVSVSNELKQTKTDRKNERNSHSRKRSGVSIISKKQQPNGGKAAEDSKTNEIGPKKRRK